MRIRFMGSSLAGSILAVVMLHSPSRPFYSHRPLRSRERCFRNRLLVGSA